MMSSYPSNPENLPEAFELDYDHSDNFHQMPQFPVSNRFEFVNAGEFLDCNLEELKSEPGKKRKRTKKTTDETEIEYTQISYFDTSEVTEEISESKSKTRQNSGCKNYKGTLTKALARLCETNSKYIKEMDKQIEKNEAKYVGDLRKNLTKYFS
jgi:hypothetical protein